MHPLSVRLVHYHRHYSSNATSLPMLSSSVPAIVEGNCQLNHHKKYSELCILTHEPWACSKPCLSGTRIITAEVNQTPGYGDWNYHNDGSKNISSRSFQKILQTTPVCRWNHWWCRRDYRTGYRALGDGTRRQKAVKMFAAVFKNTKST